MDLSKWLKEYKKRNRKIKEITKGAVSPLTKGQLKKISNIKGGTKRRQAEQKRKATPKKALPSRLTPKRKPLPKKVPRTQIRKRGNTIYIDKY